MKRYVVTALALALLSACHKPPADAQQLANVLSGDAKGKAAENPMCKLFSADEASSYSGVSLQEGTNAAMGAGCQWAHGDGTGMAMVTAVPMDYADNPSGAPHFRELPELGKGAYVAADMGGWIAGAPQGKEFVGVVITGPKASEQTALTFLNETLKRHH